MENKIEKYTYTRSLCMVLYRAVTLEAPGMTLRVEHSISHGQYCRLLRADGSGARELLDRKGFDIAFVNTPLETEFGLDLAAYASKCGCGAIVSAASKHCDGIAKKAS